MGLPRASSYPRYLDPDTMSYLPRDYARKHIPISFIGNEGETPQPGIEITSTTFERAVINCEDVLKFVRDEIDRLDELGYEPDILLFGEEEFVSITRTAYRHKIYGFQMECIIGKGPGRGKLYDLRVLVSPKLRGYCVVPKER